MENALEIPASGIPLMAYFWRWAEKNFNSDYQKEVGEYLAQAIDYSDLEDRMKRIRLRGFI